MDDIRNIFASIDGAVPSKPFASFTGSAGDGRPRGGHSAAAAGILEEPDGRYYVAYLESPGEEPDTGRAGTLEKPTRGLTDPSRISFVSEDLRLHLGRAPGEREHWYPGRPRYTVRYLEAFDDAFKAGEIFGFFRSASNPVPEPDDDDEQIERDRRRGQRRIDDFIRDRAAGALYEEVLRAEEALAEEAFAEEDLAGENAPSQRSFWKQARETAWSELLGVVTDPERRDRDLAFYRYRRAAREAGD